MEVPMKSMPTVVLIFVGLLSPVANARWDSRHLENLPSPDDNYECSIIRQFPAPKKDDTSDIIINVFRGKGIYVRHHNDNGEVFKREDQYGPYKTSATENDDDPVFQWQGSMVNNSAFTMKGVLTIAVDATSYYSEEQYKNGQLNWAMVAVCMKKSR
jgi:hypothetical protein